MAALASRAPYPAPAFATSSNMAAPSTSHYRVPASSGLGPIHGQAGGAGMFTSPTESEFSESYKESARENVVDWDEARVGDWLRSINCGQYVDLFRKNNINGENLMDMDQIMLKEMGVKKVGDRVRIGAQAKVFRNKVYRRSSKKVINRHSLATLDGNTQLTPPSSGSPRPLHSARSNPAQSRADKRTSRQLNSADMSHAYALGSGKSSSRPNSPMVDQENRTGRNRERSVNPSPKEGFRKESDGSHFKQPINATRYATSNSARGTPLEGSQVARMGVGAAGHIKSSPSMENLNASIVGALPSDKPLIRVIYENGRCSVLNIDGFRTAEDIIRATLRKGGLNESHLRAYCFWVLDGTDPNPTFCRRLGEAELIKLCSDGVRSERGRLILRKIHTAEPEGEQLRTAARIAEQQLPEPPAIEVQPTSKSRSQLKIEKLTGEPLAAVTYPMSPASQAERRDYFDTSHNLPSSSISRNASQASSASARARKLKDFYGARPPTELITQDLQSYFPEVAKEEMDRTVRMSIRRSQRLSRAVSRMSTVSNFSVASSLKDAPPIPSIADHWQREAAAAAAANNSAGSTTSKDQQPPPRLRPLSVMRLGRPESYRESIASSMLEPLDEESPLEPNRKSYVSFSADSNNGSGSGSGSGSDTTTSNIGITDPEGHTVMHSYFDDSQSSPGNTAVSGEAASDTMGSGSINSRLSRFIAQDGEEEDAELMEHLEKDSWDDLKYMKGAMIGQGSFGTVFLALHAVTAELMAVKQVEMPSNHGTAAMDAKKNQMVEALKQEISLLRDLKHPNIVQYLGSNSDEEHLNIFLEYVAGGSVATMLVNYGSLPEGLIANFVRQILQGLNYLHSKDIIHRDIKGANILVDNKGTVKISDFGISKRVEATTMMHSGPVVGKRAGPRVSLQGSVFWMAPEVVRQTAYTKKADIWSLGCLIVEMFTGSHPHPNCTQLQAIFKIGGAGRKKKNADGVVEGDDNSSARPDLPDQASEDAKEFLKWTFEIEHEKRPSAEDLMKSKFCSTKP
ncbi:MAP kinase-like protein [Hortaea werneckii]|nr:MAP kinase-like protein [Hortaea werneckii]KAI7103535.1 MAP kinase-like protein [Hortaea werneckii]KAI7308651.1 MAP kinase-like protein [Hortaea werneckii]KAI7400569.1 MAP kinase-like protein [Hortaea werneckii]